MSITDAGEVVQVIEKMGLSDKFRTLCELEALLNDGTGIIFFILFSDMAKINDPAEFSLHEISKLFINQAGIGILLGFVCTFFADFYMKISKSDSVIVINIIVVSSFLVFYLGEITF